MESSRNAKEKKIKKDNILKNQNIEELVNFDEKDNYCHLNNKVEYQHFFDSDFFQNIKNTNKNLSNKDIYQLNFLKSEVFIDLFKKCDQENISNEQVQIISNYIRYRNKFKDFILENKSKNKFLYINTLFLTKNKYTQKKYKELIKTCCEVIEIYFGLKTKLLDDYITLIEPVLEDNEQANYKNTDNNINENNIYIYYKECEAKIKEAENFYLSIISNRTAIRKSTSIKKNQENNEFSELDVFRKNMKFNRFSLRYNKNKNIFEYYMLMRPFENIIDNYTDLISLIVFTDVNIYEKSPSNEIFGRVNKLGGKIALISLNNELDSETIITCLHETIHTFGISHCSEWDCIMNSKNDINGYSSIDICPLDLMKLKLYNNDIDIIKRYKGLRDIYKRLFWDQDSKDCEEKINLYEIFISDI